MIMRRKSTLVDIKIEKKVGKKKGAERNSYSRIEINHYSNKTIFRR